MNIRDYHPETLPHISAGIENPASELYAEQMDEASDEDYADKLADLAIYNNLPAMPHQ